LSQGNLTAGCIQTCFSGAMCSWESFNGCVNKHAQCGQNSVGLQFTAVLTLITILAKLSSAKARMSEDTDNGFEKCKGMITCIIPMVSTLAALFRYKAVCYTELLEDPRITGAELGPGYTLFMLSLFNNAICFLIHLLTPVPEGVPESCSPAEEPDPENAENNAVELGDLQAPGALELAAGDAAPAEAKNAA
jgi:hypothetical protein